MSDGPDLDDMLESDKETVQNAVGNAQGGFSLPHPAKALETVLWTFSVGAVLFMLVSLFFTGSQGPLPGAVWLGFSLLGITVPGALALVVRFLRRGGARAIDRAVSDKMQ